ncbi:hypothetical protein LEMLEM_LOCUS26391, partial [Lemmus lemmus]
MGVPGAHGDQKTAATDRRHSQARPLQSADSLTTLVSALFSTRHNSQSPDAPTHQRSCVSRAAIDTQVLQSIAEFYKFRWYWHSFIKVLGVVKMSLCVC